MTENSLYTSILIFLGKRSKCCGAKIYTPVGWYDQRYCSKCFARVS